MQNEINNPEPAVSGSQDFASSLVDILNKGSLSLMISIGHRTGLFDVMDKMAPASSAEIAERAGLNERYVREWLGAMVTSHIVSFDPAAHKFKLPPENASYLTRRASADNLAVFMQYVALLGSVEDDILECFKNGGGVPYSKYERFHEVMAEDSGQSVLSSLESHIIPLVPGLSDRLNKGIRMLDAGCGSGKILLRLSEMFPASSFTGIDLSPDAIEWARREAEDKKLHNAEFIVKDLSDFDRTAPDEMYDFVTTFDAVHDQAKPLSLLKGIRRTLKNDGVYLMQDISGTGHLHKDIHHPIGTFLYTISCMHCMTVSLAQGGEGLGAMWGELKTKEYLLNAGFSSVETHKFNHDIQNNWYVVRK